MKIFIGHLNTLATEQQLIDLFAQYGPIEAAYIPKDDNGDARGFGYVIMSGELLAQIAIRSLNKTQFMGQYLSVSEAISNVGYTASHG